MDELKVSAQSKPSSVAGAIANALRTKPTIKVSAIGAGAVNQAVKAIAIARGYTAPTGKDLVCVPAFMDIVVDDTEKSAIVFIVSVR